MSRTTPVRMGMMVAEERKYAPVLRNVANERKRPMKSSVDVGPTSLMSHVT